MTGENILNIVLDLLNAKSSDGALPEGCKDLQARSVNLINICLAQCAPLNTLLKNTESYIPAITRLGDSIDYDTSLLTAVIPFGVAAYLCAEEDSTLSASMMEKYRVAYSHAMRYSKSRTHSITEVY